MRTQRRGKAAETDTGDGHPAALKSAVAPLNPKSAMIPDTTAGSPFKYEKRIELIPSTRLTRAKSLILTGP